jgi:hypothetical protein
VRVADDRCADTSLSKAIGQTPKYCDDVYLQSFPRPAAIMFECFEGDEVPVIGGGSARSVNRPLKLLVIDRQADEKSNVVMRE